MGGCGIFRLTVSGGYLGGFASYGTRPKRDFLLGRQKVMRPFCLVLLSFLCGRRFLGSLWESGKAVSRVIGGIKR